MSDGFLRRVELIRLEEHEREIVAQTPPKAIEHQHNCVVCGRGIRAWKGSDRCTKWACRER